MVFTGEQLEAFRQAANAQQAALPPAESGAPPGSDDPAITPCEAQAGSSAQAETGPAYQKVFKPKTHAELLVFLRRLAEDQSPTATGREIAEAIAGGVDFVATNNRATWSKNEAFYKGLARTIDEAESSLLAGARTFDATRDWAIDCGLMASLVARYHAGNCDDLASYALDLGMKSHSQCVLCFVQDDNFDHSFVLVYCKGDTDVWLADTWVKEHRAVKFKESLWGKGKGKRLNCRVMAVKVSAPAPEGVIAAWDEHRGQRLSKKRKVSTEHPRLDQTGAYTHASAVHAQQSGGLR